jgi:sortase A
MRWVRRLERLLFVLGLLLLGLYAGIRVHRAVLSRSAIATFKTSENLSVHQAENAELTISAPDFSLWSPKRTREYEDSLPFHLAPAIGIIRIPKIQLEVPLLEGTDDLSLNRGVGRIEGTARPGEDGNIGIAGHRDGFFRGLKDLGIGDAIEVVTRTRTTTYRVDRVVIVSPSDVSVLGSRKRASLSLVTCYPFYFIGSAPKRYIVQATIDDSQPLPPHGIGILLVPMTNPRRARAFRARPIQQLAMISEYKEKNR